METNYRRSVLTALWDDASRAGSAPALTRTGAEVVTIPGPSGEVALCCLLVDSREIVIDDKLAKRLVLTPTQARVAALIAARRTNKEIAAILGMAESTVRGHTELVFIRLGVRRRSEVEGRIARALIESQ